MTTDDLAVSNRKMLADPALLAAALGRHGVGQNRTRADFRGDVQHLIAPIVGRMRLQADADQHVMERLELVLALAKLAGGTGCDCSHVDAAHDKRAPFPCTVAGCGCGQFTAPEAGPDPDLVERAIRAAQEANEANVRLMVLMSGVTLEQFQAQHPDIARSLAATATSAVLRALGLSS